MTAPGWWGRRFAVNKRESVARVTSRLKWAITAEEGGERDRGEPGAAAKRARGQQREVVEERAAEGRTAQPSLWTREV